MAWCYCARRRYKSVLVTTLSNKQFEGHPQRNLWSCYVKTSTSSTEGTHRSRCKRTCTIKPCKFKKIELRKDTFKLCSESIHHPSNSCRRKNRPSVWSLFNRFSRRDQCFFLWKTVYFLKFGLRKHIHRHCWSQMIFHPLHFFVFIIILFLYSKKSREIMKNRERQRCLFPLASQKSLSTLFYLVLKIISFKKVQKTLNFKVVIFRILKKTKETNVMNA